MSSLTRKQSASVVSQLTMFSLAYCGGIENWGGGHEEGGGDEEGDG